MSVLTIFASLEADLVNTCNACVFGLPAALSFVCHSKTTISVFLYMTIVTALLG